MAENDCHELTSPQAAVVCCQHPTEECRQRFLGCMTKLFLDAFKAIYHRWAIPSGGRTADDQLNDAFEDGLLLFYKRLREHGWEERSRSAKLRTALFTVCYYQLRGYGTGGSRENAHRSSADPDKNGNAHAPTLADDRLLRKEREELLQKAFLQLDEKCRDFILWSLDEIPVEAMEEKYPDVEFRRTKGQAGDDKEMHARIRKRHDYPSKCRDKLKDIVDGFW